MCDGFVVNLCRSFSFVVVCVGLNSDVVSLADLCRCLRRVSRSCSLFRLTSK